MEQAMPMWDTRSRSPEVTPVTGVLHRGGTTMCCWLGTFSRAPGLQSTGPASSEHPVVNPMRTSDLISLSMVTAAISLQHVLVYLDFIYPNHAFSEKQHRINNSSVLLQFLQQRELLGIHFLSKSQLSGDFWVHITQIC